MTFAMGVVRDRSQARVTDAVSRLGDDPSPRQLLRAMITSLLPLTEESRADGRVALAFLAYTAVRPEADAGVREETGQLVEFVANLLPASRRGAAAGVLALMEGLGLYLLGGQYTVEQALTALDDHLDTIFGVAEPTPAG